MDPPAINPSSGVVVLGSALATSFLRNSHDTITMSTMENNSPEIMEIRRSGTEGRKVIDGTFIRRTPDIERSSKTFFIIEIVFGVKNEGTSIFSIRKKSVGSRVTIFIDFGISDVKPCESK